MRIYLDEQDVVDACCVWVASQHGVRPEDVDVDLQFHPSFGFRADARFDWRHVELSEQDMVDGIAKYLWEYHQFRPESIRVDLQFNQQTGVCAEIAIV